MNLMLWSLIGYLLGSIPFGIVITQALGLGDLRQIGSGNIGATNVLRTGNKPAALATLLLDSGKGAIAVLLARGLAGPEAAMLAGAAAFLGHLFPVWLGFKGGKGVATFLGTLLALDWRLGLVACGIWLAVAALGRISSLSALVAAAVTPLVALWLDGAPMAAVTAFMAVLIFIRHSANMARILAGTEPRIGRK
ncbi:glycerol-3-phosphate 1-O-acyltransferase PlsY [Paracoccus ravus]|uniref:glycerol-3-phosphate 1-O-acyltransferase PlsY n=1 Tax=Paracoccus ravus TaxID=2447760 RepID=UPI00106E19DB|nr:glycerol-3-phosphate 1-O-acyltransferase PlsY [Paracoccus ravus]